MAQRFCSRCNAEVEDAGGYCLLGHDLRLEAPFDSLKALRAEVNRTFDDARRELADVMAPAAVLAPEIGGPAEDLQLDASGLSASEAHPTYPVRLDEALVVEGHTVDEREWSDARAEDPAPSPAASPPDAHPTVWEGLDETPSLSPGDPIVTFAPSPRMDWGPRRSRFGRRARSDEQHADA
jgi:hypothetical protein